MITGLLFAFSFDTLSQVLFFSVAGKGSAWIAALLGLLFTLGILASDALNGLTSYLTAMWMAAGERSHA